MTADCPYSGGFCTCSVYYIESLVRSFSRTLQRTAAPYCPSCSRKDLRGPHKQGPGKMVHLATGRLKARAREDREGGEEQLWQHHSSAVQQRKQEDCAEFCPKSAWVRSQSGSCGHSWELCPRLQAAIGHPHQNLGYHSKCRQQYVGSRGLSSGGGGVCPAIVS